MKTVFALTLLCTPMVAAADEGLSGSYAFRGDDCSVRRVIISDTKLDMGHVQCSFTDRVGVQRMQAELRDANCYVEDQPEAKRYFIARTAEGLMLFSPDLGMELLDYCS